MYGPVYELNHLIPTKTYCAQVEFLFGKLCWKSDFEDDNSPTS